MTRQSFDLSHKTCKKVRARSDTRSSDREMHGVIEKLRDNDMLGVHPLGEVSEIGILEKCIYKQLVFYHD
jgi:hypothetical protein